MCPVCHYIYIKYMFLFSDLCHIPDNIIRATEDVDFGLFFVFLFSSKFGSFKCH